jgi:hypothetical protein
MGWPLVGVALLLASCTTYLAFRWWRSLDSLSREIPDFHPAVEMTPEADWFLLNLALINKSHKAIWVEECAVVFIEFDGVPSKGFEATCKGVLRIREFVNARETIRVGLCQTVYDAAGRPQGQYRAVICGTLKYNIDDVWYIMALPPRLIKMNCLNAIEVRGPKRPMNSEASAPKLRRSFDQARGASTMTTSPSVQQDGTASQPPTKPNC